MNSHSRSDEKPSQSNSKRSSRSVPLSTLIIACLVCLATALAIGQRLQWSSGDQHPLTASSQPASSAPSDSLVLTTPPDSSDYSIVSKALASDSLKLADGSEVRLLGVYCLGNSNDEVSNSVLQRESLAFTRGLVEGRQVRVEYDADNRSDSTARPLAYVYLEDGTSLNADLIKRGYCLANRGYQYASSKDYLRYEREAKTQQLGRWESFYQLWEAETADAGDTEPDASDSESFEVAQEKEAFEPAPKLPTRPRESVTVRENVSLVPSIPDRQNQEPQISTTTQYSATSPVYSPTDSPSYTPPVAENGSYYGQLSDRTGRPKTVHVEGYTRRDGTYVRGHYRSSPRRRN
jgi:endonuclease YncB( thermonuclease family)